jgi:CMP-N-acetylneuraminic acid synthetase
VKRTSAIINARLQSSRVPEKLVRAFANSTLIEIALSKLSKMDFFENRYFAIAEKEFENFANDYESVKILWREKESVKRGVNALEITLNHYLQPPTEWIFVINPCQPLLSVETIRKAFDTFQNTNYNSYIAAIPIQDWIFDQEGMPITYNNTKILATDRTPINYKVTHSFYIINKEYFRKTGMLWSFTPKDPFLIVISAEETFDVDTPLEFEVTEMLYLKRHGEKKA